MLSVDYARAPPVGASRALAVRGYPTVTGRCSIRPAGWLASFAPPLEGVLPPAQVSRKLIDTAFSGTSGGSAELQRHASGAERSTRPSEHTA